MLQLLLDYSLYGSIWTMCFTFQDRIALWSLMSIYAVQGVAYWSLGGLCMALDLLRVDQWRVESPRGDFLSYVDVLPKVLCNHVFIAACGAAYAWLVRVTGDGWVVRPYTAAEWVGKLLLVHLVYDLVFYHGHKLIHRPILYKRVHKLHHMSLAAMGISGYYMTVPDAFVEFVAPSLVPFFVVGHHKALLLAFLITGQLNGVSSHSGHNLPLFPYTKAHLIHHLDLRCNYGIGLFDKIYGTSRDKSISEKQS
jgi:sterol desaturase/sphingolipid hydroxylase (fatty acid hydroxylase superfamily)